MARGLKAPAYMTSIDHRIPVITTKGRPSFAENDGMAGEQWFRNPLGILLGNNEPLGELRAVGDE